LWFDELGIEDIPLVGGKNASLGEMYTSLTKLGVKIPYGFAVTDHAYNSFIEESGVKEKIQEILHDLDTSDLMNLQERGKKVRTTIMDAAFPEILKLQIIRAYRKLEERYGKNVDVAVRSSATAEDLPDASFAGQQETYLNVHTEQQILHSCKQCFASLFTDRAISYRVDRGFSHFDIALSIGVQKMVRSDLSCSGVMFSIDTESGFDKVAFITGAYGLGENVVQGAVNPDEYLVFKPTLEEGYKPIISKKVGEKHIKMIYAHSGNKLTKNVPVPKSLQEKFVIEEDEILTLAKWAIIIEDHYSAKKGHYQPMDMEWAKDGKTGELFIVQARPETVQSRADRSKIKTYEMVEDGKVLCEGVSVGSKIGHGEVKVIMDIHDANNFKKGYSLVTDMTDPDWEPVMKMAAAIITNRGGRTCHAAIMSREMGVPAVVGCSTIS
jgi:pyruvate,water dikinase